MKLTACFSLLFLAAPLFAEPKLPEKEPAKLFDSKAVEVLKEASALAGKEVLPGLCAGKKEITFKDFRNGLKDRLSLEQEGLRQDRSKVALLGVALAGAKNPDDVLKKMRTFKDRDLKAVADGYAAEEKTEKADHDAYKLKRAKDLVTLQQAGGYDGLVKSIVKDLAERETKFEEAQKKRAAAKEAAIKRTEKFHADFNATLDGILKEKDPREKAEAWTKEIKDRQRRVEVLEDAERIIVAQERVLQDYAEKIGESVKAFGRGQTIEVQAQLQKFDAEVKSVVTAGYSCELFKKEMGDWAILTEMNERYVTLQRKGQLLAQLNPPAPANPVPKGRSGGRSNPGGGGNPAPGTHRGGDPKDKL